MSGVPYDHEAQTLAEAYEAQRIHALPSELQQLVLAHHLDQFNAVPSYIERFVQIDSTRGEKETQE